MNVDLQQQNLEIKQTISDNLKTIKSLIAQADELQGLVHQLSLNEENEGLVRLLKDELKNINSSIDDLIDNTDRLFNLYNNFVETAVRK